MLQLTREHAVTPDVIAEMRVFLAELAEQHGGAYDVWQSPIVR